MTLLVASVLWFLPTASQAAVVTQLNITGGSVNVNFASLGSITGSFTQNGQLVMGQFQPLPNILPPITVSHLTLSIFTSPGGSLNLPAPTAQTSGATMTANLSSLFGGLTSSQWSSWMTLATFGSLNIGGQATGTFNETTNAFNISWTHPIPEQYPTGEYVLVFDPLDGSTNIDFNVAVGTIFAIFRRRSKSGPGRMEDVLQSGREIVAGGYLVYGSSTMLVYTTGHGVNGFTLDPSIGEFLLSHPNVRIPDQAKYYSVNQGYEKYWTEGVRHYTRWLQGEEGSPKSLSLRYIGSMVADVHRTLFGGGVFYYPADTKDPKKPTGKLRLLYEAVPMAYVIEQAGGYGSTGRGPILDVEPEALHQRTPVFVGNRDVVRKAEEFIAKYDR